MSPGLLFLLLIIICFVVALYFLRPSGTETAVQRHLENLHKSPRQDDDSLPTILKQEKLSAIPWLNELMAKVPGSPFLFHLIQHAGKTWQVSSFLLFCFGAALVAGGVSSVWLPNTVLSVLVGLVAGYLPVFYLTFLRNRRFLAFEALLPDAIDLMSRALRAGHSISSAIEMISKEIANPLGAEFRVVYEEQSLGLPLREAIHSLVQRMPRDDMRFLATALLLQKETGGNLAHILDKTSAIMRDRVRMRGQVRIYTAQARVTGWVITAIPFALFALISVLNPRYEKTLLSDPLGQELIYFGLAMMVVGMIVIRNIIDIKV